MLASLADAPLVDPAFVYEPKYDGIRAIAEIAPKGKGVHLWSRLGNEKTAQFPEIASALGIWSKRLKAHDETNASKVGDRVLIEETRPLSKDKRWRIRQVIARVNG